MEKMEITIHNGCISLPEEVLRKAHLPKEGRVGVLVEEREVRIFLSEERTEENSNSMMKILKHLDGVHPKRSIEDMGRDLEVEVD